MGSLQKIFLQYFRAEGTYGGKQSFEQPFGCLIGVELCAEKLQCDNLEFSFCVLLYSYVDKVGLLGWDEFSCWTHLNQLAFDTHQFGTLVIWEIPGQNNCRPSNWKVVNNNATRLAQTPESRSSFSEKSRIYICICMCICNCNCIYICFCIWQQQCSKACPDCRVQILSLFLWEINISVLVSVFVSISVSVFVCAFSSVFLSVFVLIFVSVFNDQQCGKACQDSREQSPLLSLSLRNQKIKRAKGRLPLINCFNVK